MAQTSASLTPGAGFAMEIFIHTDSAGDAAAELSTVTALHGIFTCVFLQPPWLRFILPYPWSKISILPCFLCMALAEGQVLDYLEVWIPGAWQISRDTFLLPVPLGLCHGRANPKPNSGQFKGSLPLFLSRGVSQHYSELLDFLLFPGYLLLGCVRSSQVWPPFPSSFTELVLKCSSSAFSKDLMNCFVLDVLELSSTH